MSNEIYKPLYKVLNERRNQYDWSVNNPIAINDTREPMHLISIYAENGEHISDKRILTTHLPHHLANAQYTSLAVNNLHVLAEALETIKNVLTDWNGEGKYQNLIEHAKTALSKIS